MIEKFPDWYRVVDPSPNPEVFERRQAAVEEMADILNTKESVAESVSFLTLDSSQASETIDRVVQVIREHDPSFTINPEDGKAELKVLLSTSVGEIIVDSEDDHISRFAALVVTSSLNIYQLSLKPFCSGGRNEARKVDR